MSEEPELEAPSKPKRHLTLMLVVVLIPLLVFGGVGVAVWRVGPLNGMWCKKVGFLCTKELPKPVVAVAPAGCPDFKLTGSLRTKTGDDSVWAMTADVVGKVSLSQGSLIRAGNSSVACYGNELMVTFTEMSNAVTYQCLGLIDGKAFTSTCSESSDATDDISGDFTK